jgi:hypothetical protein
MRMAAVEVRVKLESAVAFDIMRDSVVRFLTERGASGGYAKGTFCSFVATRGVVVCPGHCGSIAELLLMVHLRYVCVLFYWVESRHRGVWARTASGGAC